MRDSRVVAAVRGRMHRGRGLFQWRLECRPASDAPARADADPAAAPVVPAGPVRRLLRGQGPGLLRGGGLRRHDPPRRGRDRPARRSSRAARPSSASAGCRACSPRARRAPTRVVIGQIFQRSRRSRCRSRTRTSPSPRTSRARRSARGASATSPSCTPACTRPGSTRTNPSDVNDRHPAVRHGRLRGGRDRRRPGDDLQRVRPGPRDGQPGRPASCISADDLNVISWEDVRHLDAPGRDLRLRGVARRRRATRKSRSSS